MSRGRRELRDEITQTRRLNQQLSVVLRVLRHDVRNRITVALGVLERVLGFIDDETIVDDLNQIQSSLQVLHETANKALKVGNLRKTGTVEIDLADVVDAAARRTQFESPDVEVSVDVPDEAIARCHPLVPIAIDEAVDNAFKFNSSADPRVDVSVNIDGNRILTNIADNGPGIADVELETFELDTETPLQHASGVGSLTGLRKPRRAPLRFAPMRTEGPLSD